MTAEANKKDGFYKSLIAMVLPIALQNFMSAAVSASDAVMLGFIDQDSLSAVSLASQINFIYNLFIMIFTISTTMLAAQYWGKGDRSTVEKILGFSLKLSFAVSLIFTLCTLFIPDLLMRIFTGDTALIGMGAGYLRTVSPSFLLMGFSQVYLCIMKNSGRTTKSTIIGSSVMILNVVFNGALIYGIGPIPAMGITGAAAATVAARFIEAVWILIESSWEGRIKIRMEFLLRTDKFLRSDYIKNAVPILCNYLVWGCGFTMYSVIMGHLGSDAVAAHSIANIMKNLVICVCSGIGTAGGILVGNELGKGNIETAIAHGGRITKLALASGVLSGVVLLCLTPLIVGFADLTDTARGYLQGMLLMCSCYMIGKSVNATTIGGVFCAGGDAKFGFYCDSVVMWLIMVPLGLLSAFVWNLPVLVVYFILSLDEFLKLPVMTIHYKKYKWAKNLTRNEAALTQ